MKRSIISTVLALTIINLSAQNTNYDYGLKFDCDRAIPYFGLDASSHTFAVNYQGDYELNGSTIESAGGSDALLVGNNSDSHSFAALIASSGDDYLLGLATYTDDQSAGYLLIGFEDTLVLDIFDELAYLSSPIDGGSKAIVHADDGAVAWIGMLHYDEATIHHSTVLNDGYVMSGHFTDSLVYEAPDGTQTVVQGHESNITTYVLHVGFDGQLEWVHTEDQYPFVIPRHLLVHDQSVYFSYHNVPNATTVVINGQGAEETRYELSDAAIHTIAFDEEGSMYMCGNYDTDDGLTDFDLRPDEEYYAPAEDMSLDAFLVKYTPDMEVAWLQRITGDKIDTGTSFDIGRNGIYWTGCIQSDGIFDPDGEAPQTYFSSGLEDAFVAHYGFDGSFRWVDMLIGPSSDIGMEIESYPTAHPEIDDVVVFGVFLNSIDLDPSAETEAIFTDDYDLSEFSYFLVNLKTAESTVSTDAPLPSSFTLYPNPASDWLEVVGPEYGVDCAYTITNSMGQQVASGSTRVGVPIDVSFCSAGIYFVALEQDGTYAQIKVVKM